MKKEQESAKIAKKIFDLCNSLGDGVHGMLHLILSSDDDRLPDNSIKQTYRGYHATGYCFDVSKEPVEIAEDEVNNSAIGGFEYVYMEGINAGFKELSELDCITMLLNI